jgi:protein MpaA
VSFIMKITAILGLLLLLSACGVSQTQQQSAPDQPAPEQQMEANFESESARPLDVNPITEVKLIDEATVSVATQPAKQATATAKAASKNSTAVESLCKEIGNTLGSVSVADCLAQNFSESGVVSVEGRPIVYQRYLPLADKKPKGKVLLVGGIHGDEYSSVSIVFKWLQTLDEFHSGLFNWYAIPLLNPDGLLQQKAQRQNANGVDLNRNFPTPNWDVNAAKYWEKTGKNVRRYPGSSAGSEIESQLLMNVIDQFKPDVIISVHAPHSLVDYDGPPKAPNQLGNLQLRRLGVYPGSLGNYAGVHKGVQVITIELSSAGVMPDEKEVATMWTDLVRYLVSNEKFQQQQPTAETNDETAADVN